MRAPQVSLKAMPLYSTLPMITEVCVENGWTMTFSRIDQVRGAACCWRCRVLLALPRAAGAAACWAGLPLGPPHRLALPP
jgi:hypothetical protein